MSIEEPDLLTRARHTDTGDAAWAQGAITHETAAYDAVGHTAGLMRAHAQALHGSGVALGLDVRLAPAEHGVVIVGAGFAVDALGQHIALVPGGFAEVAPDARSPDGKRQSATVEDDGVRLPIPSVTAELVVAIKHFERAEKVGELSVLRHTPWLGWVAESDLAPDGPYVPLAKITVVHGNATAITAGPRAAVFTMTGALSLTETSNDGGVSDQLGASIVLDQGSLLIDKAGAGGALRLGARDVATRASLPLDRIELAAKETRAQNVHAEGDVVVDGVSHTKSLQLDAGGAWVHRKGGDAAIVNDRGEHNTLMIVGADYGTGRGRSVDLWDTVTVHGSLVADGALTNTSARTTLRGVDGANNHWIMVGGSTEGEHNALGFNLAARTVFVGPGWTKNFMARHPLAPEEKRLLHATLEGPEAAVYYRGEAELANGVATVHLPEYFEALTRREDRSVLVTPRFEGREPISALAASRVVDGRFHVRAIDERNPSQAFYWEVKAVRADVARLEVEPALRR
ncbi:MAG: hypothetical protein U0326_08975 [Polyangiales bacterium]